MENLYLESCLDRKDEKKQFINSLSNNRITIINTKEARGATTLLKHIFYSFILEKKIVFFLDFKRKYVNIANQLGKQLELYLSLSYIAKDAFAKVLPRLLSCIRLPGTDFSVKTIISSIKKIHKVGKLHIDDPYEELINLCHHILCNKKPFNKDKVYFIIDNATEELETNEDFLLKMASNPNTHFMLLCNNNRIERFINFAKRLFNCTTNYFDLSFPPDELIQLLCTQVYKLDLEYCKPLIGKNIGIYDICRNLSNAKNCNLSNVELDLCNLVYLFNNILSEKLLKSFLNNSHLCITSQNLDSLLEKKAILKDSNESLFCGIHCNDDLKNTAQEILMTNYMCDHLGELNLSELVFFHNYTNVLNLKSRAALLILKQSVSSGIDDYMEYAKSVDTITSEDDLILILCCLYKLGLYRDGIEKIMQFNKVFHPTSRSKFMYALFLERKYDKQALIKINKLLVDNRISLESKCFFAIAYVSCIINIGTKSLLNDFFDINSVFYYKKFCNCGGYAYLLNALGNNYKTDELLLISYDMLDKASIGFNKAIPNLIAFYDNNDELEKCKMLLEKSSNGTIVLSSETAFYYNNKALHDLKYGTDDILSILATFNFLRMKNRSEAATLFSTINYSIALIFSGDVKNGINQLIALGNKINNYPSKPLLDNYQYNLCLAHKCFSSFEQWRGCTISELTDENRNFAAYTLFLSEKEYNLSCFKKHVKLCYLYERKFNIFTLLDARL